MMPFDSEEVKALIRLAVSEDLGGGDVTTESVAPPGARARADVVAREAGVAAGLSLIRQVIDAFGGGATVELKTADGEEVEPGHVLAVIEGPARVLLSAERTMLNFLGRLSGIATLTRRFVEAVSGTAAKIYDTRKTTPGWRALEKHAVRTGGGHNHRMGLHDQVLIKDNHLALMKEIGTPLAEAVSRIRRERPGIAIEIESATEEDVRRALEAKADIILLDNMTPEELTSAVKLADTLIPGKRPVLEASGGVDIENVRAIAGTGVDRISVGALTHSAHALDVAVDFDTGNPPS